MELCWKIYRPNHTFSCSLFVLILQPRERSERRAKIKISLKLIDIHFILVLLLNITDFMGAVEH